MWHTNLHGLVVHCSLFGYRPTYETISPLWLAARFLFWKALLLVLRGTSSGYCCLLPFVGGRVSLCERHIFIFRHQMCPILCGGCSTSRADTIGHDAGVTGLSKATFFQPPSCGAACLLGVTHLISCCFRNHHHYVQVDGSPIMVPSGWGLPALCLFQFFDATLEAYCVGGHTFGY